MKGGGWFKRYGGPSGGQPPHPTPTGGWGRKVHKVVLSDGLNARGMAPCPTLMVLAIDCLRMICVAKLQSWHSLCNEGPSSAADLGKISTFYSGTQGDEGGWLESAGMGSAAPPAKNCTCGKGTWWCARYCTGGMSHAPMPIRLGPLLCWLHCCTHRADAAYLAQGFTHGFRIPFEGQWVNMMLGNLWHGGGA